MGVAASGDSRGGSGLAREVLRWHGGELWRRLGFGVRFYENPNRGDSFYMGSPLPLLLMISADPRSMHFLLGFEVD
jgi:hypothetical protein